MLGLIFELGWLLESIVVGDQIGSGVSIKVYVGSLGRCSVDGAEVGFRDRAGITGVKRVFESIEAIIVFALFLMIVTVCTASVGR